MLKRLRNLSPEVKKKIILFGAGSMTFLVFVFWIMDFSGTFADTYRDTKNKGAAVFSSVEENVGKVYNAFEKIIPKRQDTVSPESTTTATTTDSV